MRDGLASEFELSRPRLRAVAYRMLGSAAEAEDAVQEAWLRLDRAGRAGIGNLEAWLTTVVGRVCLDMLRSRTSRREASLDVVAPAASEPGPEQQAELADSVGLALIVVLETLSPTERLAFVLHDLFGVSFDEIAPIVGRSPDAARQLASRARRRVRGSSQPSVGASRELVDAFLRAARGGEVETLLTLLDPDVRLRSETPGAAGVEGAPEVARFFAGRAQAARPALIDGALGVAVLDAEGQPWILMLITPGADGRIAEMEAILGPEVADFDVSVLSEPAL
ncbi:sigma-70 family RNA polymerase sigma factor [Actinoplanes sp. NPDC051411]|uniref:sigma-70 family RNA polymerase sigma factor n=1 Tax=Actinoplanes sp. NPDC051411 TaxID=3155522 RepID=UPI003425CF47